MMEPHFTMNDELFEVQFKAGTFDPAIFTHEAHLRLAWIHIKNHGVEAAVENICSQLQDFVEILGAAGKYNHTLTIAAIRAVNHFMHRSVATDFADFISQNPRLKYNFKELMACHYTTDIFTASVAKEKYLAPDLLPF